MFNVGDKVRVLSKTEISSRLNYDNRSTDSCYFNEEMFKYCDKIFTVISKRINYMGTTWYQLSTGGFEWDWSEEWLKPAISYVNINPEEKMPDEDFYISAIKKFLEDSGVLDIDYKKEEPYKRIKTLAREFINSDDFLKEEVPFIGVCKWFENNKKRIINTIRGISYV